MENFLSDFVSVLKQNNKEQSVMLCLDALEKGKINIFELYLEILTPALNRLVFPEKEQDDMIWQEHIQSSIVRSIIEASYPYVLRERKERALQIDKTVIVFCPEEEQHELGARMAADFFYIEGYNTIYLGARTPAATLIKACTALKPEIIVMSITNYFNLVSAKKTIEEIRKKLDYTVRIMAGGSAFCAQKDACRSIGTDLIISDLLQIADFRKEELQ